MRRRDVSWAVKVVMGTVVLLLIAGVGVWQLGHMIKASYGYSLEGTFTELPADDEGLERWMKAQPGVVEHTVHAMREGKKVRLLFIMSQAWGEPGFPPLEAQSEKLGYRGGRWEDARR